MIGGASIGAAGGRLVSLKSTPPVAVRSTAGGVYLVGSAAGPLGGDEVSIRIDLTDGARLTVRSSAASVVLRGSGPSLTRVCASVGAGCALRWAPEPTVLTQGCEHRIVSEVSVAAGAELEWWEEIVLGRHGERSGSATARLEIDYAGEPLLRHELAVGPNHPESATPAVAGSARAIGSVILAGERVAGRGVPTAAGPATVLALDGPAVQVTAVAGNVLCLRNSLRATVESLAWTAH